jgi:hypothetical protein
MNTIAILYRPSTVTINGICYKIDTIVVTGYLADMEMPEFGLITKIIYLPNHKCYFKIKKQIPTHFNTHFHSFQVAECEDPEYLITEAGFFTHVPMHLVHPINAEGRNASWFVVLPYSSTVHIDA